MASSQRVVMFGRPKLELSKAPHSPFATGLLRSQSGTKLALASFHVRLTVFTDVTTGLFACATLTASEPTYRPSATLSAVRPLPSRS